MKTYKLVQLCDNFNKNSIMMTQFLVLWTFAVITCFISY